MSSGSQWTILHGYIISCSQILWQVAILALRKSYFNCHCTEHCSLLPSSLPPCLTIFIIGSAEQQVQLQALKVFSKLLGGPNQAASAGQPATGLEASVYSVANMAYRFVSSSEWEDAS
jgi:hypothetical protein